MPNGGSDCCGTCWFNQSLEGQRGSGNFNREIPSRCEIRGLDIPDPFYTYCANHPYHRPQRDEVPIGPVFRPGPGPGGRDEWMASPDTEAIRLHLLEIVRRPENHADSGYHFYTHPAYVAAGKQLLDWGDERLVPAMEELSHRPEASGSRTTLENVINQAREQLLERRGS